MKLLNYLYLVLGIACFIPTTAQAQYGNEWIQFDQSYYKMKIGQEGLYHIDYQTLVDAGIPLNSINPKQLQLYRNGVEVPMYIQGEDDNVFHPADFIEFHGFGNDGKLDNALYRSPTEQAQDVRAIINDTAYYFLTWGTGTSNLRITNYQNTNFSGKTADNWIWYRSAMWFKNEYYDGNPYSNPGYFSEYTEGEGWFGHYIARNTKRKYKMPSKYYNSSGPLPEYEFLLYGKADPTNPGDIDGMNFNHETTFGIKAKVVFTKKFRGYAKIHQRDTLTPSYIHSSLTEFRFSSTYLSQSRQAVSYVMLDYPRDLHMDDLSSFVWDYTGSNDYFKFTNYQVGRAYPIIYDDVNRQRIRGTLTGQELEFLRSNNNPGRIFIADTADQYNINTIELIQFLNIDPSTTNFNFILVTHPVLDSSAQLYKDYRSSAEGGGYQVQLVFTPDLYNTFYYGYHHPMALRNFYKFMYDKQLNTPEYTLLLGKGQTINIIAKNSVNRDQVDLVPTWGIPPSDYPFVTDLGFSGLSPAIAIGRVPAVSNQDVVNYLDKLKLHEQLGNETKTILQLTGGETVTESELLRGYQEHYYGIAKGEKLGANRISYYKDEAVSVTSSLVEEIQKTINDGVYMVGYFGHGAAQVLEVDIGPVHQLDNFGKYPLFYFEGCALGHSFGSTSLPENYLLEPDNGGIAWIASSAYGFINELNIWSVIFYQNMHKDLYGESIGKLIQETMTEFQNPFNHYNRSQCRQMTYHGDPAIKFYAPKKPDYEIVDAINIIPENVTDESDSFALVMNIANHGIASKNDTPNIFVKVQYLNDSVRTFGPIKLNPIFNKDTVTFWIPNNAWSPGLNRFTLVVDSGDYVDELDPLGELNNVRTFEFFMPSNSVYCISPIKDQIIYENQVKLIAQNNNLVAAEQEYIFEMDTTPRFDSPVKLTSPPVLGTALIEHSFTISSIDSVDFYWRVRLNDPAAKWSSSTFAYIYGSEKGWSQGYFHKFDETDKSYVELDTANRKFLFSKGASTTNSIYVSGARTAKQTRRIFINGYDHYPGFIGTGVACVALDPITLERYMDSSQYNKYIGSNNWGYNFKYYWVNSRSGAYWFNTAIKQDRDSFVHYLNNIPEGYHLFLYASGYYATELWEDTVFSSLEKFGASAIRTTQSGHPYGLFGTKGMVPGEGVEVLANFESPVDPLDQTNEFSTLLYPISIEGSITSKKIGPATSWSSFYRTVEPFDGAPNETLHFDLYGVDQNDKDSLLFGDITTSDQNLLTVDALQFPYIKVQAKFKDSLERSPAHINRWTLLYEGVPEGSLDPDILFTQNADSLQQGDSIHVGIAYRNISDLKMDSVLVLAYLQDYLGNKDTLELKRYADISEDEFFELAYHKSTNKLSGNNRIVVSVNPGMDQLEQSLQNNIHSFKFYVEKDYKNPLLDVVFDGEHIMDLDIVPHNTTISMSVLDENEFIFVDDPEMFDAQLTHPDGSIEQLLLSMDEVSFSPASKAGEKAVLAYTGDLPSGEYKLSVNVVDGSGNPSSEEAYEIRFVVDRDAAITNVYPYPNPFTSSMRFVFTLTGEQLPDYMKIQILTVSGKVVREINHTELGALKIGNNISEFIWDGTDQFGDRLANGVYLFKVTAKLNGEDLKHRESSGDQFFNEDYGKIYIMR